MNLTPQQKKICEQIINVFESGSIQGDYSAIAIYRDGPHGIRQVTYGRSQTTEYGNLEALIRMYADRNGLFGDQLKPYIAKIGVEPLVDDTGFKKWLREAGKKDPVMSQVQDDFFDQRYFNKAMTWASNQGFTLPLSALVIYDSFIHSGSILDFLRKRFPESIPAKNGNEQVWVKQYVDTRQDWLVSHPNKILRKTVYRTQCFKQEIAKDNWQLTKLPIIANGIAVTGS